jgi:competence ComEA-like helix-hairpin-helix protein
LKTVSRTSPLLAAIALVTAVAFSSAAESALAEPQDPPAAAGDEGPRLFARMCSDCHDAKRIVATRRTGAEWEDTLKKMIEEGAEGTEKDFEAVFAFLQRTYGKVFINSARSSDIRAVLGLPAEQADAIVSYRTANGPFADLEAVKKVPGIDLKKLDDLAEAVAF